jgi:hypothetical protein
LAYAEKKKKKSFFLLKQLTIKANIATTPYKHIFLYFAKLALNCCDI